MTATSVIRGCWNSVASISAGATCNLIEQGCQFYGYIYQDLGSLLTRGL